MTNQENYILLRLSKNINAIKENCALIREDINDLQKRLLKLPKEKIDPETRAKYNDKQERIWLKRKLNSLSLKEMIVLMDTPSTAGCEKDDRTTEQLKSILTHNNFGSFILLNINIDGWNLELSKLSVKDLMIAWGCKVRDKAKTKQIRNVLQKKYNNINIWELDRNTKENMPTFAKKTCGLRKWKV